MCFMIYWYVFQMLSEYSDRIYICPYYFIINIFSCKLNSCHFSYTCSNWVMRLLRERGLGNSAGQLIKTIWEQHSEDWLHRSAAYLTACEPFTELLKPGASFREPPTFPGLPRPKWLLSVYVRDVLLRIGEVKAKVTSTYSSILKMDSTKKVCI